MYVFNWDKEESFVKLYDRKESEIKRKIHSEFVKKKKNVVWGLYEILRRVDKRTIKSHYKIKYFFWNKWEMRREFLFLVIVPLKGLNNDLSTEEVYPRNLFRPDVRVKTIPKCNSRQKQEKVFMLFYTVCVGWEERGDGSRNVL